MRRTGLLTEEGLAATRAVWDGGPVDDTMHWSDLQLLNIAVIEKLATGGRQYTTEEDREAMHCVLRHWIFPMTSLDLTMAKVKIADLKRKRERWLAHEMGVLDELDGDYR